MIKPKALKYGNTIGIIAPSGPAVREKTESGKKFLEELGFSVVLSEGCYGKNGYLAGTDERRLKDLHGMFENPDIHGIICLKGGYGTPRILDGIDIDLIIRNPKVFMGYSDITALHVLFNQQASLVTFHGPMIASEFYKGLDERTVESMKHSLMSDQSQGSLINPEGEEIRCLFEGRAKGRIIGGNLALIAATMGTPYEIDTKDKLLFLEDVGEDPYRIDRMLTQLRLGGKLKEAAGIIFGDFKDCEGKKEKDARSLRAVLSEFAEDAGIPAIYNLQTGHCLPHLILPLGVMATLDATEKTVILEESGVISDDG